MTTKTLEQEARELYKVIVSAMKPETPRYTEIGEQIAEFQFVQGYLAAATARDKEMRQLRLLAEEQLTTLRKLKAEMLSDTRDKEIEELRAELAKVTEQRDAWPKYCGRATEGLMVLHDRKDLQDLSGLRCGDFMANAVPHIVEEIDRLRARVKELEGMVPRWARNMERYQLEKLGWLVAGGEMVWHRSPGDIEASWHFLMVPPIPLPEGK